MARWQFGEHFEHRAAKSLSAEDCERARLFLNRLSTSPPHPDLGLQPVHGYDNILWECRAGGQNKCILRRVADELGAIFIAEDIGPYFVYRSRR
jgi:hypothetical protein